MYAPFPHQRPPSRARRRFVVGVLWKIRRRYPTSIFCYGMAVILVCRVMTPRVTFRRGGTIFFFNFTESRARKFLRYCSCPDIGASFYVAF